MTNGDSGCYTKLKHYWVEHAMRRMSGAEWKVVSVILRDTEGWEDLESSTKRRQEAEITIERFIELTGMASQAVCAAIQRLLERGFAQRRPHQIGRQRKFRFRAIERANLKSLKSQPETQQEQLDFGNQNPSNRISEIKIPTTLSLVL